MAASPLHRPMMKAALWAVPTLTYVTYRLKLELLSLAPQLEPEPGWLAPALRLLPIRELTEEERALFAEHGVVLVRRVVPERGLVQFLASKIVQLGTLHDDEALHKAWFFHGPVRVLVREQLLASLASSALGLGGPQKHWMLAEEAPIWFAGALQLTGPAHSVDKYHADDRLELGRRRPYPLVSVWLALSDAVAPLEFLNGSHLARQRVESACGAPYGTSGLSVYYTWCMKGLGYAPWSPDVEAGDAFVFNGNTLHRRLNQQTPRLALSVRYAAQDGPQPQVCMSNTYIFPRSESDEDCVRWTLVPRLGALSPTLSPGTRGEL